MRALRIGGLICAAALLGCGSASAQLADTVFITVHSQPEGAYITDMLKHAGGIAPQVYSYPASQFKKDDNGCIYTYGFDARWGSGAAASSTKSILLCPSASKDQFYVILKRDPSAPGLDKDLRFSMELADRKQNAAAQVQAEKDRRENAMIEGLAEGFAGAMGARAARQPVQVAPLRCTSKRTISGSVDTVCE
jgi:hypothetical protein